MFLNIVTIWVGFLWLEVVCFVEWANCFVPFCNFRTIFILELYKNFVYCRYWRFQTKQKWNEWLNFSNNTLINVKQDYILDTNFQNFVQSMWWYCTNFWIIFLFLLAGHFLTVTCFMHIWFCIKTTYCIFYILYHIVP